MNKHYNDLLYGDKKFVIDNDSLHILNTDISKELRIDNGVFNQIVSCDYICNMKDSSFSMKDKLLELEKDHNLLREEFEEMRGESDKRTMSGIVRDPYGRL